MSIVGKPQKAKPNGEPGWSWRRAVIFPIVIFACWQLTQLVNAPDTRVNETIAWGWIVIIAVLVLGYTGFATAQDIVAIVQTRSGTPYAGQGGYGGQSGYGYEPGFYPPQGAVLDPATQPPPGAAG